VTFTLGASADFLNTTGLTIATEQFNPKVGLTWNILPSTTLRAAAFKAFKRTLMTDQTLEPTQVAGFNQFFDDPESTESRRYGVAVDQKFSQTIFGGVELSRRDLTVPAPFTNTATGVVLGVQRVDWKEYLGRAYLFWTPHEWVALSTEYQYERFDRVKSINFGLKDATTQRVPLGLRLFHPSGLSLALKGTYVTQNVEFQRRNVTFCCEFGESDFWVVDAALSYRLPKRYGLITVGATNLFDQKFKFQEADFDNATIQPDRTVFGRVTLAFP
jgi:outer membrane receptor protein involved in Fe transport